MRQITKTYKVYNFEELTEKAQQKALEELYYINVDHDWWDWTYTDANEIGIDIKEFDIDRGNYCKIEFQQDAIKTAEFILDAHGKITNTYQLAKEFLTELDAISEEQDRYEELKEDLEHDFKKALSEEYLSILRREYEYLTSEEAIKETIEANEYEFLESGVLS